MAKVAAISVRVEPELKVRVEEAAKAESRTVSQWVELLIQQRLPAPKLDGLAGIGRSRKPKP